MKRQERRIRRNLMKLAYAPYVGRFMRQAAAFGLPPLYGTLPLSAWHEKGFISPKALLTHSAIDMGKHCFIGRNVMIYKDERGGPVHIGDRVHIHEGTTIQTGEGGSVVIGHGTHIQPRCQFSGYCAEIVIGERVEVAPSCAIYPYNHSMVAGVPIREQPLYSRSGVVVEDDAWLSFGVVLLDGARVGKGAVIAANSVVNSEIPENAIAAGSPARVVSTREAAHAKADAISA